MDEYITKKQVIDWFMCYGHNDNPIFFEDLLFDIQHMIPADVVPALQWVPVKERVPGRDGKFICVYSFKNGSGMQFAAVLDYYASDPKPHFQNEGVFGMTVTHWMSLPELPKEDA